MHMIHETDNISLKDVGLDAPASVSPLLHWKEVAYVGKFGHYDHNTGAPIDEIDITPEVMEHWHDSIKKQVADGVRIPIQDTHEDNGDVDKAYGSILDAKIAPDSKGRSGLHFLCEFGDEEKAKIRSVSDVSVYQPPSFAVAGKVYARPVRHLMLTTKPAVTGLDKFVALSLAPVIAKPVPIIKLSAQGHSAMLKPLLTKLGITFKDDATDEQLCALLETEVVALRARATPIQQAIGAGIAKLLAKSRESQLSALVTGQVITPAVKDKLAAAFADNKAVALSADGEPNDDIFDNVLLALQAMPSGDLLGKKRSQDSDGTSTKPTTMVDMMKERAARAAARN